jgi:hypothetical protein
MPPARPAPRNHPFELTTRNYAAISVAPSGVMHVGYALGVAFARVSDGDDCLNHAAMLKPLGPLPQDLLGPHPQLFDAHCE